LCPLDGYANPLLITPLSDAARRLGAELRAFTPVTGIRRVGDDYKVALWATELDGTVVVNAAGPWITEISALAGVGIQMSRSRSRCT